MFIRFHLSLIGLALLLCCSCAKTEPVSQTTNAQTAAPEKSGSMVGDVQTPEVTSSTEKMAASSEEETAKKEAPAEASSAATQDMPADAKSPDGKASLSPAKAASNEPVPTTSDPVVETKTPMSPKEMLKVAGTGVVVVNVFDALGEKIGFGSGCIVGKGRVLTNYHVIAAAISAQVQTKGAKDEQLSPVIKVTGVSALDQPNDLAILIVDDLPDNLHTFAIADSSKLEQFDKVFAIGHPDGLKFSMSSGLVNALMKTSELPEQLQAYLKGRNTDWIQTDAVISGGSSGGPLLNEFGEIVGINTLRVGNRSGLAVRAGHVKDLLDQHSELNSPLPVPDANVLITKTIAAVKRGYDLELRQFMMDVQRLNKPGDQAKVQELVRKNNPGPACLQRCQELAKKHRGEPEAVDALKFSAHILTSNGGQLNAGRFYLDGLLESAAQDPLLITPSIGSIGALQGLPYSNELDHYLRSVVNGDSSNVVKGTAGVVLVAAMASMPDGSLEAEMLELAREVSERFGDEMFRNEKVRSIIEPVIAVAAFSVGNIAPDIVGKDLDDQEFRLSEFRGKVVVLDFWADWCPHCRNMYPSERKLVERLKEKPFALLGVNGDEVDRAKRAIQDGHVTWRSWLDGPQGPIGEQYKIQSWPTVFVLDRDGRIQFKDVRNEALDAAVDSLLNESQLISANDLIAADAEWKFRAATAADELANWQNVDFNDSSWTTGTGPFEYGREKSQLTQEASGHRPLTTIFRKTFDLPGGELPRTLLMRLRYRDGIAVFLNGKEIYRDRMNVNTGFDDGALSRVSDRAADGTIIPIESNVLNPTGNCLAIELHQFSKYSAKPLFELTVGSPPDLQAIMANATVSQQLEICRLLEQTDASLPGVPELLEKLQKNESPEIQLQAAVAAALCKLPVSLTITADDELQQALVTTVIELNEDAWSSVSRDGLSKQQYETALRKAQAVYQLMQKVSPQYQLSVQGGKNTYGVALYRTGQFERATEIFKESISAVGDNPVDTAYLGLALLRLGKTSEAQDQRQHLTTLLAINYWKHSDSARQALREVDREFGQ